MNPAIPVSAALPQSVSYEGLSIHFTDSAVETWKDTKKLNSAAAKPNSTTVYALKGQRVPNFLILRLHSKLFFIHRTGSIVEAPTGELFVSNDKRLLFIIPSSLDKAGGYFAFDLSLQKILVLGKPDSKEKRPFDPTFSYRMGEKNKKYFAMAYKNMREKDETSRFVIFDLERGQVSILENPRDQTDFDNASSLECLTARLGNVDTWRPLPEK